MRSKLRGTDRAVNARSIEEMWAQLHQLWKIDPLGFMEYVRKARKRRHQLFVSSQSIVNLMMLGLLDSPEGHVHDAYRDLVRACVEGKGLAMTLHRPFENDCDPIERPGTLRDGRTVSPRMVNGVMSVLRMLMDQHFVAFVELARLVRGQKPGDKLYGNSLAVLLRYGVVKIDDYTLNAAKSFAADAQAQLGGRNIVVLMPRKVKVIAHDAVAAMIRANVTGSKGVGFDILPPFKPKKTHEGNGQPIPEAAGATS